MTEADRLIGSRPVPPTGSPTGGGADAAAAPPPVTTRKELRTAPERDASPLLQTTAVAKAFGPVVALRAVDLSVAPGEVHALLEANGAGKSTLVKILTGVLHHDSGTVAVNGEPRSCAARSTPGSRAWRRSTRTRR